MPELTYEHNYTGSVTNPYRGVTEYNPRLSGTNIRIRNNIPTDNLVDIGAHELSHTSDWNGTLIPQSDQNLMEKYSKDAPDTEFNNYVKRTY
jgi:hypothetical protein